MLRLLDGLSAAIDAVARVLMTVLLGAVVLLVIGEVFSRNLFNLSFPWLEEVTMTFLGTWLVFIGASHAMNRGMLASMDFVVARLPRPLALACALVSHVGMLVFLGIVIMYGIRLANAATSQPSPSLQVPMTYAYAGLVMGACFMWVHAVTRLLGLVFRRVAA